jgi:hypothetical protein
MMSDEYNLYLDGSPTAKIGWGLPMTMTTDQPLLPLIKEKNEGAGN